MHPLPCFLTLDLYRFTLPADHTLGIGMGSTDFLATAIERGRSGEMYQTKQNEEQQEALRKQADAAFRLAFNKGMFQVRRRTSSTSDIYIDRYIDTCCAVGRNP